MMRNTKRESDHCRLLFKHKAGSVNVEVWGPRIGWEWQRVELYRWEISRTVPGQWEKVRAFRGQDVTSLEKCINAVKAWQMG